MDIKPLVVPCGHLTFLSTKQPAKAKFYFQNSHSRAKAPFRNKYNLSHQSCPSVDLPLVLAKLATAHLASASVGYVDILLSKELGLTMATQ